MTYFRTIPKYLNALRDGQFITRNGYVYCQSTHGIYRPRFDFFRIPEAEFNLMIQDVKGSQWRDVEGNVTEVSDEGAIEYIWSYITEESSIDPWARFA